MGRSVDEKLEYNRKKIHNDRDNKESLFAYGYVFGVDMYRGYPHLSNGKKREVKEIIDDARILARSEDWHKGIMCGVRDAANERKAKKRK